MCFCRIMALTLMIMIILSSCSSAVVAVNSAGIWRGQTVSVFCKFLYTFQHQKCVFYLLFMLPNLLQYFFCTVYFMFQRHKPAYNDNYKIWSSFLFWSGVLLDSCYSSFSTSVSDLGHLIWNHITVTTTTTTTIPPFYSPSLSHPIHKPKINIFLWY